uniref:Acetolactate synthase n=1 Tax=Neotessella volvocina TaxID=52559 RepID=A0A3G2QZQ6_9STRA|nr:acetohydroxyacid synthase large subunit [Neotessella volvocina]
MTLKQKCLRTGAYVLLDSLIQNGAEHIFGYPGGAILPIYDELYHWEKAKLIKHILVRHEQGAVHAADAYARTTNKVGICFATSGPGATNLVTGIATARMDSIPLIIITGQVARTFIGTDAFQETDIFGITLPIIKHSYVVLNPNELPDIISEAFFLAQNGRPGPVLIDIPKDVGLEETNIYNYKKISELFKRNNYRTEHLTKSFILKKLIKILTEAYQPLFYIGGGVIRANAFKIVQQFSKLFQIPLTTTLMGKSSYNENDHLALGMLGMHGTAYANFAVSECDLLITLGARFDDRVTGKLDEFACDAQVVHLDIDPAEISKNRSPQLAIIGDIRKILLQTLKKFRKNCSNINSNQTIPWLKRIYKWKESYPLITFNYNSQFLSPQETINFIGKINPNAFFTTDVGQHQMWSAQLINCQPKKWISSAGLGTMGFGLPAAIGVKIANPIQDVFCISGDSSFQMNIQELGTIAQYELIIKIIIINNGWQGMVRQWQESFYGNRFSNSYMKNGMPNFANVAKAYNLLGYNTNNLNELKNILIKENNCSKALLIDVDVIENENCYPMVAPGKSNSQMLGLETNIE